MVLWNKWGEIMKNKQTITLSKEKRQEIIVAIQGYFLKERDEELGQLAAGLFLDFLLERLGPELYNQGVSDSYKYMQEKLEDMLVIQK